MLAYILEVSIYWSVFCLAYQLFLKKLTFFKFNRWYLLSSMLLGLIFPFVSFSFVSATPIVEETILYLSPISNTPATVQANLESSSSTIPLMTLFLYLYWSGVVLFFIQFLVGLYKIFILHIHGTKTSHANYTLVQTKKSHFPFSFFNCVYWSQELDSIQKGQDKILAHELSHVRDGHSFDIIFMELVKIFLWCSPLIYWYKKSLRQVHEYIADHTVLKTTQLKNYGHLLLSQSESTMQVALANHFIQSQLKNRITMMLQKPSGRMAKLKYLLIIPVIFGIGLLISAKSTKQFELVPIVKANGKTLTAHVDYVVVQPEGKIKIIDQALLNSGQAIEITFEQKISENKIISELKLSDQYRANDTIKYIIYFSDDSQIQTDLTESVNKIPPNEIERVNVLKGKSLTDKYPEMENTKKVAEIYTKLTKAEFLKQSVSQEQLTKESFNPSQDKKPEEVFKVVEMQPRFPGCEDSIDDQEQKEDCAKEKMLEFIYQNIKYPETARNNNVQGMNVVRFIVEKDGSLSNIELVRDIGGGTSEESINVIEKMNAMDEKWTPGYQNGEAVRVQYNLPIRFKLEQEVNLNSQEEKTNNSTSTEDEIISLVEHQPRFPGCENSNDDWNQKEDCAKKKMLEFIYQNIKYPESARKDKVQGVNVVRFVVEKDGSLSNIELVRDIGGGTGEESMKVVEKMKEMEEKWTPGIQNGKIVRVYYNLPIRFKLGQEVNPNSQKDKDKTNNNTSTNKILIDQSEPLIILYFKDGGMEEVNSLKLKPFISPDNIEKVNVLKGVAAIKKYPKSKGKSGVVEIYLKLNEKKFRKSIKSKQSKDLSSSKLINKDELNLLSTPTINTLEINDLVIFPNPAKDKINIAFTSKPGPMNLTLVDASGKEIYFKTLPQFDGAYNKQLTIQDASPGMAILKITQNEKVFSKKILVQ